MSEVITDVNTANMGVANKRGKKVIGIFLLVLVIIGISVLLYIKGNLEPLNELIKVVHEPALIQSKPDSEYTFTEAGKEQPFTTLSPSHQELLATIPGLVTDQNKISNQMTALSTSVEAVTRSLTNFKAEMDATLFTKFKMLDQFSVNSINLQSQLTSLDQHINTIDDSVMALKKIKAVKRNSAPKPIIKKVTKPPFKLMSIQLWNSRPVAIVTHNKTQLSIGDKEVLAGWLVDSISNSGCMKVSRDKQTVELCQ